MFEYQDAEKKGLDAYTVMARAIRTHYDNDEEKITPALSRTMAKIIDDGFLNGTIEEQSKLIAHSKKILDRIDKERREQERKMWTAQRETRELEAKKEELVNQIAELYELANQETDPFLLGAKKAYKFILAETRDKEKASKGFNSYLQGIGKWKQYQDESK